MQMRLVQVVQAGISFKMRWLDWFELFRASLM